MVLGVVSPDFIKRSASQPLRAAPADSPKTQVQSKGPSSSDSLEQLVIPKHRNFSKPFGTGGVGVAGGRRTQSEFLFGSSIDAGTGTATAISSETQKNQDSDGLHKIDPTRRVKSCSLPQGQSQQLTDDGDGEGEGEHEAVRKRSISLGAGMRERLRVDDRARTWGGVPSTEMTVSGRTFWRSVLGSSARERESGGGVRDG